MGVTFAPFRQDACCLCGSTLNLTGEHKIKASALRNEFGSGSLLIRRSDDLNNHIKLVQSVKSKVFHFTARICSFCNTTRTQPADREFDRFHQAALTFIGKGEDPRLVFNNKRYPIGSEAYLNIFRYFAKLLCCHIAEVGGPRPLHMSRFALGLVNANCIWLAVDDDWTYKQTFAEHGPHRYAAHGGLVVYGHKKSGGPRAFHSTRGVGALRYVFFSRLNWFERLELRLAHPKFYSWCREQTHKAMDEPVSTKERLMLGLTAEDPPE